MDNKPAFAMLNKIKYKKYHCLDQIRFLTEKITYLNQEADKIRIANDIPEPRTIPEELKQVAYKTYELATILKSHNHDKVFDENIIQLEQLLGFLGARVAK